MKKLFMLFLLLASTHLLHAQLPPGPASIAAAQNHIWDVREKYCNAVYNLEIMKLDWTRGKLLDSLTKVQASGNTVQADKLKAQIADIDSRKDKSKQKLDLNIQLYEAKRRGDDGAADAALFKIRNL